MRFSQYLFLFSILILVSSCGIFQKKSKTTTSKKPKTDNTSKNTTLEKYSQKIGTEVTNLALYSTIDQWMGVPYKYGGKSKSGIDCSNFTCEILRTTFAYPSGYYYPSSKLAEQGREVNLSNAVEGDIVCFAINQNSKISHVGIYLANKKFVHASTSKGVVISSLDEDYYKKRLAYIKRLK